MFCVPGDDQFKHISGLTTKLLKFDILTKHSLECKFSSYRWPETLPNCKTYASFFIYQVIETGLFNKSILFSNMRKNRTPCLKTIQLNTLAKDTRW